MSNPNKSLHTVTLPRAELEALEKRASEGSPVESIKEHTLENHHALKTQYMLEIEAPKFDKQYEAVRINGTTYFKQKSPFDPF